MGPHICTLIPVLMVNIRICHNEKVLREMEYTKKYEKKGKFAVKGMEIQWGLSLCWSIILRLLYVLIRPSNNGKLLKKEIARRKAS